MVPIFHQLDGNWEGKDVRNRENAITEKNRRKEMSKEEDRKQGSGEGKQEGKTEAELG